MITSHVFRWHCNGASGTLDLILTPREEELIKKAARSAFSDLADCDYLKSIRKMALKKLPFYDPRAGQDICISFPEDIVKEVNEE